MHERAVISDVVREIEQVGRADRAARVTRIVVRLGALSHFTPEHFRDHFAEAARDTIAEGAVVDARVEPDLTDPHADGVVVESIEVES